MRSNPDGQCLICAWYKDNRPPEGMESRWKEMEWNRSGESDQWDRGMLDTSLGALLVHLLRSLQNFIALENLCIPSLPVVVTPSPGVGRMSKKLLSLSHHHPHQIQPGLLTAAQPFFHSLFIEILADPSLKVHHSPVLDMLSASLLNLHSNLEDLAPRILRQLCRNLETAVKDEIEARDGFSLVDVTSGAMVVVYLQALINITHWCLFGDVPRQHPLLQHNSLNRFWDASSFGETDDSEEILSPATKQPSTMSWILGVFASGGQKSSSLSGTN